MSTPTPPKVPANPDTQLTPDELVAKLNKQTGDIEAALKPLADILRNPDNSEVKPPVDLAGLNRRTAQAYSSQFTTEMKVYGANGDIAKAVNTHATTLRRKLSECLALAREMLEGVKDAEINRITQAQAFAAANAPKITKLINKEDERIKKANERKAKLTGLAAGTGGGAPKPPKK